MGLRTHGCRPNIATKALSDNHFQPQPPPTLRGGVLSVPDIHAGLSAMNVHPKANATLKGTVRTFTDQTLGV